MKPPKNAIITKLWDSFVLLQDSYYFFTKFSSPCILDLWLEEGRNFVRIGSVEWQSGLGTKARLRQQDAPEKNSNSGISSSNTMPQPYYTERHVNQVQPSCEPGGSHQPHLAKGHSTALGTPQLSDVYSIRPDRSSPPVRWCDFVLERSILHTILTVFIHSFIHLCVFCARLQWNQSCDIFSSEEFKWELLSVPIFPLSK